jgi:hypothetical protein
MAAALGGDVSSNAIQLGKALNDPSRGDLGADPGRRDVLAISRRTQIKQMVATGNVAGAQKVILES